MINPPSMASGVQATVPASGTLPSDVTNQIRDTLSAAPAAQPSAGPQPATATPATPPPRSAPSQHPADPPPAIPDTDALLQANFALNGAIPIFTTAPPVPADTRLISPGNLRWGWRTGSVPITFSATLSMPDLYIHRDWRSRRHEHRSQDIANPANFFEHVNWLGEPSAGFQAGPDIAGNYHLQPQAMANIFRVHWAALVAGADLDVLLAAVGQLDYSRAGLAGGGGGLAQVGFTIANTWVIALQAQILANSDGSYAGALGLAFGAQGPLVGGRAVDIDSDAQH